MLDLSRKSSLEMVGFGYFFFIIIFYTFAQFPFYTPITLCTHVLYRFIVIFVFICIQYFQNNTILDNIITTTILYMYDFVFLNYFTIYYMEVYT